MSAEKNTRRSRGGERGRRERAAEQKRKVHKVYAEAAALIREALGQWVGKEYDIDHETWGLATSGEALLDQAFTLLSQREWDYDEVGVRARKRLDDAFGEMDEGRYLSDFARALFEEAADDLEVAAKGIEVPRPAPVLYRVPSEAERRFSVAEVMGGATDDAPEWVWMMLGELVEHGVGIDTGAVEYLLGPDVSAAELKSQLIDYYVAHLGEEYEDPHSLVPDAHAAA